MEKVDIQIVEFGSLLQRKSIELRTKILREPLGLVFTIEQLADEKDEVHIVATIKDDVIGVLLLKQISRNELKMRQVAVNFDLQKSGIGKQLVLFSEKFVVSNNFKKIELHARAEAVSFYLKLDYHIIGDKFTEVGIEHFKMIKLF